MRLATGSSRLLWLAVLIALGTSSAAAQGFPPGAEGAPEAASADGADLPTRASAAADAKAPADRHFFDDFSSPTLYRRNWITAADATPILAPDADAGSVAMVRIGAQPPGPGRQPDLRSAPIPLAGIAGAELSFTVRHAGVAAGERLTVECLLVDGRWQELDRVVADGRDVLTFARRVCVLPEQALHAASQIRFRPEGGDADGAWYLGEVSVVGSASPSTLTVRLDPARGAAVELVVEGSAEPLEGVTPFTRVLPVGARVFLVAPPEIDERVFSHWTVGESSTNLRQRILELEVKAGVEAVAHYRPWGGGRSPASVAIVSIPEPGVPIALGTDPERLYTNLRAETEYHCLTGEWLTLLAPPRTDRLVFAGWVVNGQAISANDNLLEHRVTGDDVLLAEYVLLGDMNGDGALDKFDVEEFVAALIDPVGYLDRYPDLQPMRRGDVNGDGEFDALDVEDFVELLLAD